MKRILFTIAAVAAVLVALDLLALAVEVATYGTWYRAGQPVGLYIRGENNRPQLRPGAVLPGLRYHVRINEYGFRGEAPVVPKPEGRLRLWVLGGSTCFDIYARDDASAWPSLAAAKLEAALPDREVDVVNAGIPGEVMLGSRDDLHRLGPTLSPDYVVIYHGPNDLRNLASRPPPAMMDMRLLGADVALFRVLRRGLTTDRPAPAGLPAVPVALAELAPLESRLLELVEASRGLGAVPVLATHALRASPAATGAAARAQVAEAAMILGMDAPSTIAHFGAYNDMVRRLAAREHLPLAEVHDAVPHDPDYWGDATHFLRPGAEAAAEEVAATILDHLGR